MLLEFHLSWVLGVSVCTELWRFLAESMPTHCLMWDYFFKETKHFVGCGSNSIKKNPDGQYPFLTKDEVHAKAKNGETATLWEGMAMPLSCAQLLVINEYRFALRLVLTPGLYLNFALCSFRLMSYFTGWASKKKVEDHEHLIPVIASALVSNLQNQIEHIQHKTIMSDGDTTHSVMPVYVRRRCRETMGGMIRSKHNRRWKYHIGNPQLFTISVCILLD